MRLVIYVTEKLFNFTTDSLHLNHSTINVNIFTVLIIHK